jgi:hypothetical protein
MEMKTMKAFMKTAAVASVAGLLAIASITPSEARGGRGWAAAGIGLAAGAAIASAAAANSYYYGPGYYGYYGPGYAYEPYYAAPAYGYSYGYAPGFEAYAYAPGYYRGYRGVPRHYDPGYGYNSNTTSPQHDLHLQGRDY